MQKLLLFSTFLTALAIIDIHAMELKPAWKGYQQNHQEKRVTFPVCLPRYAPLRKTCAQRAQDQEEQKALRQERIYRERRSRTEYYVERLRLQEQDAKKIYTSVLKNTVLITCLGAMVYFAATSIPENPYQNN